MDMCELGRFAHDHIVYTQNDQSRVQKMWISCHGLSLNESQIQCVCRAWTPLLWQLSPSSRPRSRLEGMPVPDSPQKMHATDSGTSSLSHALLSSLRCDTMDPDLAQVIDKRRSTTGSGQNPGSRQSLAQGSGVSIAKGPVPPHAAKSEERDRLYFVLLEKAAKLECEKSDLQGQLESLRSDAKAYEEVALELEADLKTATAENKKKRAEIATLKATDKQSEARLPMARLAEDVVTALQARPRRYSQLSLPSLGDDAPISDDAISMGSARLDLHAGTRTDSVQEVSGLQALLMRRDERRRLYKN